MSISSTFPTASSRSSDPDVTTLVVPVIEESVVVEKRLVDRGGWRITKRVEFHDEVVDEPLASEQVEVERRAVGRLLPSMDAPVPRQEGDTWIVPVLEEVLVTEKRLMLKEEIRITRVNAIRHEPLQVSLRRENVTIERLEPIDELGIGSP